MKKDINKLARQLKKELTQDILIRYDISEYWDIDIIETFYQDNQLTDLEANKIDKILGV